MHLFYTFTYLSMISVVAAAFSEFSIIKKEDVHKFKVLETFPSPTTTSCIIQCRNHKWCSHTYVEDEDSTMKCFLMMVQKEKDVDKVVKVDEKQIMSEITINEAFEKNTDLTSYSKSGCTKTVLLDLQNLALRKPASQSTGNTAGLANDGLFTEHTFIKLFGSPLNWWMVKLDKTTIINFIKLYLNSWALSVALYDKLKIRTQSKDNGQWKDCIFPKITDIIATIDCGEQHEAINVQISCVNEIYLYEVEIYGFYLQDMKNLALSKPTHQSSTLNKYVTSNNAVDNVLTSYFSSDVIPAEKSWWSVDLNLLAMIYKIELHVRNLADHDELTVLYGTRAQQGWRVCQTLKKPFHSSSQILHVKCNSPVDAQYIKIIGSVDRVLALNEVQIMGFYLEKEVKLPNYG